MVFEYKVVPAPLRGTKEKGLKTPEDRFAKALSDAINALAAEGWEYVRTDTLPSEERSGLRSKTTVFRNMLVFRRMVAEIIDPPRPTPATAPVVAAAAPAIVAQDPEPEDENEPRTERPVTAPLPQ